MLEPVDQQYVMIGYIAQSHGVDGTVLIIPELYAPEIFDDLDLVHLQDARGDLFPARIESVRVQEKNTRLSFFVKFDHITDRTQAEVLKNFSVYIRRDKAAPWLEDNSHAEQISYEVLDEQGLQVGIAEDVIENPAQSILMVQTGKGELLIPVVDEYVTEVDDENNIIYCKNLEQLSDL